MPKEDFFDSKGDLGYLAYAPGVFDFREAVIEIGKWKSRQGKFGLAQYIPVSALPDLLILVQRAIEKFPPKPQTKGWRK